MTDDERSGDGPPPEESGSEEPGSEEPGADQSAPDEGAQETPAEGELVTGRRPVGPIVRAGCLALIGVGVLSLTVVVPSIADPEGSRCSLAKQYIEDANDDDEEFNDVELGDREADDLDCDEAISVGSQVRDDEDDPDDFVSLPSEGAVRTQGVLITAIGLGQAFGGFATMRTGYRRARTVALVFAAMGLVIPVLGFPIIVVLAFVVYALAFSAQARALWGGIGGGLFRGPPRQSS